MLMPNKLNLNTVKIEYNDLKPRVVHENSHWFFAHIDIGSSKLMHFVTSYSGDEKVRPTIREGERIRVDGDLYMVLDCRFVSSPLVSFDPEPSFYPTATIAFVYRVTTISEVYDTCSSKGWVGVQGETYRIPDDDPQLLELAQKRVLTRRMSRKTDEILKSLREGTPPEELEIEIDELKTILDENANLAMKCLTRTGEWVM